jgi:GAF domain-containing protein
MGMSDRPGGRSGHEAFVELGRDVRNGLQGIFGAVSLLLGTSLTAEQREYVGYVSGAAEELENSVGRREAELSILADIAASRAADSVEHILAVAREVLGMDVSFVSRFTGDEMTFRALDGAAKSFGWQKGEGVPLDGTYCKRVVGGKLPNVVPDAKGDERVANLDITREAGIGSYVGLPLRLSDGSLYGTLCCLSHTPDPYLQERDTKFMEVLARLLADRLEREELEGDRRK